MKKGDRVVILPPNPLAGETGVIVKRWVPGSWWVRFDTATRPCTDCKQGAVPLERDLAERVLAPAQQELGA